MNCTFSELKNREVISTLTGARIGYIDDIEIDTDTGKVISLVIYGRSRMMGLLGRDDDVVISCEDITKIGEDTVLVSLDDSTVCNMHKNKGKDLFE